MQLSLKHLDLCISRSLIFERLSSVICFALKLGMLRSHGFGLGLKLSHTALYIVMFRCKLMLLVLEAFAIILVFLHVGLEDCKLAVFASNDIFEAGRSGGEVCHLLPDRAILVQKIPNLLLRSLEILRRICKLDVKFVIVLQQLRFQILRFPLFQADLTL